jgi:MFS family permease
MGIASREEEEEAAIEMRTSDTTEKKSFLNKINNSNNKTSQWTFHLILCCLTVTQSSLQFGFNISSLNNCEKIVTMFFLKYYETRGDLLWTWANSIFVVGGMCGALTSKCVLDNLGRKNAILLHYLPSLIAATLSLTLLFIESPVCFVISRFFYGIHGGMSVVMIPTYLSEISPASLRGSVGVWHQMFLTFGILLGQILSLDKVLGNFKGWMYLISLPFVPTFIGFLILFLFFDESPKALLIRQKNEKKARKVLIKLRNNQSEVDQEIEQLKLEAREIEINKSSDLKSNNKKMNSFNVFFQDRRMIWRSIVCVVLQLGQQLSGINAVRLFFFFFEPTLAIRS